jgi:hypothetical protein
MTAAKSPRQSRTKHATHEPTVNRKHSATFRGSSEKCRLVVKVRRMVPGSVRFGWQAVRPLTAGYPGRLIECRDKAGEFMRALAGAAKDATS